MSLQAFLKKIVDLDASDGFLTVGAAPTYKVDGALTSSDSEPLSQDDVRSMIYASMSESLIEQYTNSGDANYAIEDSELGRFRASAYIQRAQPALVVRRIKDEVKSFAELGLPAKLKELSLLKRGLVMVVGATGAGKSTTLAAMVDYRNSERDDHIITVEDPIEFVHSHKRSIISQREVGIDTDSYEVALKTALRQAPNVIMIGEIRDAETMQMALSYAETGHLCLCTLHATGAKQALERVQSFFPDEHVKRLWMDLSINLKAVVGQQLIPRKGSSGRVAVVELMLSTMLMQEYIRDGEVNRIPDLIKRSSDQGMQTFDQAIIGAYKQGLIASDQALRAAESENDVRLAIKLAGQSRATSGRSSLEVDTSDPHYRDKWWPDKGS
ncbi:MAG: PilT/PilU family type 4a pilus ATPase [Luminiphilus sp.]|nr:PilT/PilU family type 4a pilus ATPase [Luminiphilus sp.]